MLNAKQILSMPDLMQTLVRMPKYRKCTVSMSLHKIKKKDYKKINIHFSPCAVWKRERRRCEH